LGVDREKIQKKLPVDGRKRGTIGQEIPDSTIAKGSAFNERKSLGGKRFRRKKYAEKTGHAGGKEGRAICHLFQRRRPEGKKELCRRGGAE